MFNAFCRLSVLAKVIKVDTDIDSTTIAYSDPTIRPVVGRLANVYVFVPTVKSCPTVPQKELEVVSSIDALAS